MSGARTTLILAAFALCAALHGQSPQPSRVPPLFPGTTSLLWVGAHPDDEVLAAPVLARLCIEERLKCTLLVMTRGERGRCLLPGGCGADLGDVREAELAKVGKLYKARVIQWLLPDGGADADGTAPAWDAVAHGHQVLLGSLRRIVTNTKADLVLTLDPRHGSTCHADHRAAGKLVLDALAEAPVKPPVYLLETQLVLVSSPLTIGLRPAAPASAGVFAFDASTVLPSSKQSAWQVFLQNAQAHASQFDARWMRALGKVPTAQRAVWLGLAEPLLAAPVPACE
jgi:LmbE family N-acetylglucosaminyl deacetylase